MLTILKQRRVSLLIRSKKIKRARIYSLIWVVFWVVLLFLNFGDLIDGMNITVFSFEEVSWFSVLILEYPLFFERWVSLILVIACLFFIKVYVSRYRNYNPLMEEE
jgi:hypothetical protein